MVCIMLLETLISICCVAFSRDTLDVATVSASRHAAVTSVAPLTSISRAKIERMGATDLHEILKQAPGVSVRDYGGIGGLKTVSVRNMGAAHTAVNYDGIPVSDAQNGQVDISRFDLEDVAVAEVTIGMTDDIFRSARQMTAAGILRMENHHPSVDSSMTVLKARMTAGSFNTYSPYLSVFRQFGKKYALKASAKATFSDGDYPFLLHNGLISTTEKRENSDVRSGGSEIDFHADWGSRGRLKAKVNWHETERGLPGSVVLYTSAGTERLHERNVLSSVMYDNEIGCRWLVHADAGFCHAFTHHLDTAPVYTEPQHSRYWQNEYSAAARAQFSPSSEWRFVLAEDIFINDLDSDIPECPFPTRLTSMSALSGEYAGDKLKVNAAVVGTAVVERVRTGESPDNLFRLTPMAGLSWNLHPDLYLRASIKEGFRVPTFNDLYYARVGNTGLKPETAHMSNLGVAWAENHSKYSFNATLDTYCNLVRNKIVATPTMFIWKMRNVGEALMYGLDLTASGFWQVAEWLRIHADGSYSLQYALDVTDSGAKNFRHQLPYTPRHAGSAHLALETKWFTISYNMTSVGKRYSKGQNIKSYMMEGFFDHGVSLNRTFIFGKNDCCRLHVSLEARNLGGVNYEIINYYPMPGRYYRITIRHDINL